MNYTIKAYPTTYRGVTYRSRLEARWAAFFTELGWQFEYEPFDLGGWTPDFLIRGMYGTEIYVEIKPISDLDSWTGAKMLANAMRAGLNGHLLLCGISPFPFRKFLKLGWDLFLDEETPSFQDAYLGAVFDPQNIAVVNDYAVISHPERIWNAPISDQWGTWPLGERPTNICPYKDRYEDMWGAASAAVQWHPEAKS